MSMKTLIFVCALIYLSVELALNAAILDLVAPGIDYLSVRRIQDVSGVLGGIGIGLLIMRLLVNWLPNGNVISVSNLALAGVIVTTSAWGIGQVQGALVSSLVDRTNGEQRKDAIIVVGATYGLMSRTFQPRNLNLASDFTTDPTSRAGIILFSPLAIWGDALGELETSVRRVIKNTIWQRSPEARQDFESAVARTCQVFTEKYQEYAEAANDTRRQWAPRRFDGVYAEKRDEFLGYTGSLPLGLPKNQFVRHPDIQGFVRHEIFSAVANQPLSPQVSAIVSRQEMLDSLNRLFARKVLDPCMSWETFRREYVGGIINYIDSLIGASIDQREIQALEEGGRFEEFGKNAVLAAIGPPLAFAWFLLISVFGLSFAFYWILREVLSVRTLPASAILCGFLGLIFWGPLQVDNAIVDSPGFSERREIIRSSVGTVPFFTLEWVLKTAPIIYPVTSALRDKGPGRILGINDTRSSTNSESATLYEGAQAVASALPRDLGLPAIAVVFDAVGIPFFEQGSSQEDAERKALARCRGECTVEVSAPQGPSMCIDTTTVIFSPGRTISRSKGWAILVYTEDREYSNEAERLCFTEAESFGLKSEWCSSTTQRFCNF